MRVLSGIQPSGSLHLGNYFGMMKRMIASQTHDTDKLYCFIVNYHALTTSTDPRRLKAQTLEAAMDFLALGLDPEKVVFWVQSDLPEVTELTWILSNITSMGLLERCHSYKDKIAQGLKPNHGLFAYPILMTADILIMQGEKIPVGSDQKQHVEVARDIAIRFNKRFGDTFKVPEPVIDSQVATIPGIDGQKMSKAYNNTIGIFADQKELKKCVASFKTDSTPVGQAKKVEENNLYRLYANFLDQEGREDLKRRFAKPGLKYSEVKAELVDVIWNYFAEARQKRRELGQNPRRVLEILKNGAGKARVISSSTMKRVREITGIAYDI